MVIIENQSEIPDEEIKLALELIESEDFKFVGKSRSVFQSDGRITFRTENMQNFSKSTPGELRHAKPKWNFSVETIEKIADQRGLESAE